MLSMLSVPSRTDILPSGQAQRLALIFAGMTLMFRFSSCVVASLLLSVVAHASDNAPDVPSETDQTKYTLRYRVTPGQVLRYRSNKAGELRTSIGEHTIRNVERVIQVRRFQVTDIDDFDQAQLVMQYEQVEMSVQANDEPPIIFRSSMKPSEVPRYFVHVADGLRRSAPRFLVTPTGAPVDGLDEIIPPKDASAAETRLMMPLPDLPVRVGDSWKYFSRVKVRVSKDLKRDVRLLTTCQLESVKDGVARIAFATSAVARLKSNAVKSQLISALPRGYALLDLDSGQIIKRVIRNNNSVHGVKGPQSLLTYSAEIVEELLPTDAKLSQR